MRDHHAWGRARQARLIAPHAPPARAGARLSPVGPPGEARRPRVGRGMRPANRPEKLFDGILRQRDHSRAGRGGRGRLAVAFFLDLLRRQRAVRGRVLLRHGGGGPAGQSRWDLGARGRHLAVHHIAPLPPAPSPTPPSLAAWARRLRFALELTTGEWKSE